MKSLGIIKRGDTFSFTVDIVDSAGVALTGAASKLKCHGKYYCDAAVLTETVVTETVVPGTYLFTCGSTAKWIPTKRVVFDIQFTDGGVVSSTETFEVEVEEDITT